MHIIVEKVQNQILLFLLMVFATACDRNSPPLSPTEIPQAEPIIGPEKSEDTEQSSHDSLPLEEMGTGTLEITNAYLTNGSGNCADHAATYMSNATDIANNVVYIGKLAVVIDEDTCTFSSNAIPNHDFNDGRGFVNGVSEQNLNVTITANPQFAIEPTNISLQYDNAILLNGVKVDLIAAACYGVGNGFIGCNDMSTPYRYDPMSPHNNFGTDSHNAHTQPSGEYHYHGNPNALFDDSNSSIPSPVIGFAADGFPIFGSYFDDNNTIRKATSSYQLKTGSRDGGPGGEYDGRFIDDFEYIDGSGDLDKCNGMTINGVYGYYVTDTYPHILGCFSGTPHESFRKSTGNAGTGQPSNSGDEQRGSNEGRPDLSLAAEQLGVTEQELRDALGPPPPNLEAAAKTLGITLEALQEALGRP